MFFIVIPLSGSMITEKNEGAFMRMKSLPVDRGIILLSKVTLYLIVCLLQFCLMILMGTKAFPAFFELPPLVIGSNYVMLALTTVAAALAAIGFGILVGTFSATFSQAALFGSVFVVILGMLSGSFFPMHMMPDIMKNISLVSPMRWGIDSYLHIFIRGDGIREIWHYLLLLILFFILSMILSIYIFARRK
jgi:ABC-2 type transport system permease protein